MITLLDIRKSCNAVLKEKYPNIPIKSQDISKGFVRPSFTTTFDEVKNSVLESQVETSLTVMIYYFPDLNIDDYYLHLDDVKFNLPLIIGNKLKVLDRYLNINEPTANIVDGIVVFEFDMLFYQDKDTFGDIVGGGNGNGSIGGGTGNVGGGSDGGNGGTTGGDGTNGGTENGTGNGQNSVKLMQELDIYLKKESE